MLNAVQLALEVIKVGQIVYYKPKVNTCELYFNKTTDFAIVELEGFLRTPVRKYREFRDSTKKSNFFLFFQKVPFDELFSKKICKGSSAFYFLRN